MSLLPQVLLSNVARDACIAKLKKLPPFIYAVIKEKFRASVLLPLFVQDGEVHLLYTLRASNLKAHSGQVSFPGGKMEGTESVIKTALREADEEIGLSNHNVEIWSVMPEFQGQDTNLLITPVVGLIKDLDVKNLCPNVREVEEIFSVPMSAFCDKQKHAHALFNRITLPIYLHGKHKIWGTTGVITHSFLQSFLPSKLYVVDFARKKFKLEDLLAAKA